MSLRTVSLHAPIEGLVVGHSVRLPLSATLQEAAGAMLDLDATWVVIEDDPEVLLTERDVCTAVAAGREPTSPAVDSAGRTERPPITVRRHARIVEVAAMMLQSSCSHALVELGNGAVGVVPLSAVLAVLVQAASTDQWLDGFQMEIGRDPAEIWIG